MEGGREGGRGRDEGGEEGKGGREGAGEGGWEGGRVLPHLQVTIQLQPSRVRCTIVVVGVAVSC